IQGELLCKKSYLYVFLFAFVLGFGIYTYQQILYFFLAVLCHFLIILLRLGIKNTPKFSILQTLFPVFVLRKKSYKITLSAFYLLAGVGLLFSFYEFFSNSKSVLHGIVGPAREVVLFAALLVLISVMIYLVHYLKQIKSYFLLIFTFISGLMFGISPLLYYYIIQHKAPRMHITARGSWTGFVDRFFILARGNMWFLNFDLTKFSDQILVLVLFFIFLSFFIISLFGFYQIIFKNKNKATLLEHSPVVFLVPVVILGFSLSGRVMDLMGARYSLVLWFFYATGLGWFLVTFWNRYKYSGVRTLLVCLFVWILMQNSSAFYKDLTQPRRDIAYRQVITALEKNQIQFGYSEYWTSYAVNFLSQESIILDTITPGYNPHYAEPVKNASKIAYVIPKNNETSVPFQREIHIINNTYTVKGRADTERYYIILLEKKT
ncbi:MAG: hypothetical protein HY072_04035, partial [Deltaproteobacteria bacterium]|nr:hypothetical protein [Deltaproteobacteria bacterium]